eukprot:9134245-Karenia_brevis.AAC.1
MQHQDICMKQIEAAKEKVISLALQKIHGITLQAQIHGHPTHGQQAKHHLRLRLTHGQHGMELTKTKIGLKAMW